MNLVIVKRPYYVPQSSENFHLIISSASRRKAAGLGPKHCEDKQHGCNKSNLPFIRQATCQKQTNGLYLVEMATSTLHLKLSIVGKWGSFMANAAPKAARL